ncbi:hypothetical protein CKM354_000931500 [Cercospora kikuchii]|uniref:Amine oxidase n=1 Tax=Cercospora kikuchii TaxID=84275 RepID=A0A9P3CRD9_9PEZI|nr:uncharacterized protein CKM354_000931500 [Cercospora kikuchii]GIZ46177.1 hypothetical protein CKM354_000931500 [Cercospora kikuchii]
MSSLWTAEVDNGIQWKHTNQRTGNAAVVRKRQLVLQIILTVANSKYIFAWILDKSGEITFETRATGILSTQPAEQDVKVPWGTLVANGVMAPHHQHLFNIPTDPAVGGYENTFACTNAVPMPWDEKLNPLGPGYVTKETQIVRASAVPDDLYIGRVIKTLNENKTKPVSLTPIAYKLVPIGSQMLLAQDYTNQFLGGTGIKSWIKVLLPSRIRILSSGIHSALRIIFESTASDHARGDCSNSSQAYNSCLFNPTNDVPPSTKSFKKSTAYE